MSNNPPPEPVPYPYPNPWPTLGKERQRPIPFYDIFCFSCPEFYLYCNLPTAISYINEDFRDLRGIYVETQEPEYQEVSEEEIPFIGEEEIRVIQERLSSISGIMEMLFKDNQFGPNHYDDYLDANEALKQLCETSLQKDTPFIENRDYYQKLVEVFKSVQFCIDHAKDR